MAQIYANGNDSKTRMGRSFLACISVSQPNFQSKYVFRTNFVVRKAISDKTFGNKLKLCVFQKYI